MPKTIKQKRQEREQKTNFDLAVAELEEFCDLANWETSKKGNPWRKYENYTISIFKRRSG